MAEPSGKDPAAIWHELVAQWEKGFNAFANQAMGSEEFSGLMHKATSASLGMQQAFGAVMSRYLAALNLPSRNEMNAIGERLQAIEASLKRIEAQLARQRGGDLPSRVTGPRPPRTRQPSRPEPKP
jgi:Poly(R)-hydroxyalkanoic acid synthase subunit (PHA_synth_III_E)